MEVSRAALVTCDLGLPPCRPHRPLEPRPSPPKFVAPLLGSPDPLPPGTPSSTAPTTPASLARQVRVVALPNRRNLQELQETNAVARTRPDPAVPAPPRAPSPPSRPLRPLAAPVAALRCCFAAVQPCRRSPVSSASCTSEENDRVFTPSVDRASSAIVGRVSKA
ncbi:proline-rich receptor-like protein kinase PERK2 [Triticum urartu]|uniref:proline-rich receptor-like protein kinase PERK2 n=1 Tax=Triticum urartu TaxID=4572 RepID=UPI002043729B|nr:proline-rich receptor-like protein kinase PERK2 [Triticum urartu]